MRRTLLLTAGVVAGAAMGPATAPAAAEDGGAREAASRKAMLIAHAAARLSTDRIGFATLYGARVLVVPRAATLATLRAADPRDVVRGPGGVWTLRRTVVVTHGARLTVRAPEVRELRLASGAQGFADVTAWGADLTFAGARGRPLVVRSWDPRARAPDRMLDDGRSAVAGLAGARVDARDVAFAHLGYFAGVSSGVAIASSYTDPPGTGTLVRSSFDDNYFGAYTYNARGMRWLGDRFEHNVVYGLDPHDNSDGFLVRGNRASANGRHGIIFSRFCDNNVISDNVVERNGWHGIVLDDGKAADGPSSGNVVSGNVVRDNHLVGVSLDGSGQNLVTGNRIRGGVAGIRVYGPSRGDTVSGNDIAGARDVGVLVVAPAAGTVVAHNRVSATGTGVRLRRAVRSQIAANRLSAVRLHGIAVSPARPARATGAIEGNAIQGAGPSPIAFSSAHDGVPVRSGTTRWRYPLLHRAQRDLSWIVGPGLWLLLVVVAVGGGLVVRTLDGMRRILAS